MVVLKSTPLVCGIRKPLYQKISPKNKTKQVVHISSVRSRGREKIQRFGNFVHTFYSHIKKKKKRPSACMLDTGLKALHENKHFWKANTLSEQNQAISPQLLHQLQIMIGLFA